MKDALRIDLIRIPIDAIRTTYILAESPVDAAEEIDRGIFVTNTLGPSVP